HRSKRAIEELVAELSPRPDAPTVLKKVPDRHKEARAASLALPVPQAANGDPSSLRPEVEGCTLQLRPDGVAPSPAPAPRASLEALSPARYKVQFTATADLREKLDRLQALMRSQVPDGDLGVIIEQAVTEKLERLEARRFGVTKTPRKAVGESDTSASSRYI